MKTTVDVFISYCFNPCCAGSIVTAVFSDVYISDETPADLLHACAFGVRIQPVGNDKTAANQFTQKAFERTQSTKSLSTLQWRRSPHPVDKPPSAFDPQEGPLLRGGLGVSQPLLGARAGRQGCESLFARASGRRPDFLVRLREEERRSAAIGAVRDAIQDRLR